MRTAELALRRASPFMRRAPDHLEHTMFERDNHRPRSAFVRLFVRGLHRWQRQRAVDQLQAMDDGELWDIGLTRNDIPRAVEGLFSKK